MRKFYKIFCLLMLTVTQLAAQYTLPAYAETLAKADSFYFTHNYPEAASLYAKVLLKADNDLCKATRLRAARAAAEGAQPAMEKRLLGQLITEGKLFLNADVYEVLSEINGDTVHQLRSENPQWKQLNAIYSADSLHRNPRFNRALSKWLEDLFDRDQFYRTKLMEFWQLKDTTGKEARIDSLGAIVGILDSMQIHSMDSLLRKDGWPPLGVITAKASTSIFLSIQHGDDFPQLQEKLLPLVTAAYKKGYTRGTSMALLTDRVLMAKKRQQLYGSQVNFDRSKKEYFAGGLLYPEKVNAYRASVGLTPLWVYLKLFSR